jgi:hypothetical protein
MLRAIASVTRLLMHSRGELELAVSYLRCFLRASSLCLLRYVTIPTEMLLPRTSHVETGVQIEPNVQLFDCTEPRANAFDIQRIPQVPVPTYDTTDVVAIFWNWRSRRYM